MQASQSHLGTLHLFTGLEDTFAGKTVLAVSASLFVALCAHVSLPLLFTPVPLTLGNFAVVLVGLVLGPRLGLVSLVLYLAEGASGLPVFNPGPLSGLAQLFGPTAGYLFAYPLAAALAGGLAQRLRSVRSRFTAGLIASTVATALVLLAGILWLAHFAHLSSHTALLMGLFPFLPGECLKVVFAAGIFSTLTRKPAAQE